MNIISYLKKGIATLSVLALSFAVSPMVNAGVQDFSDYSAIPSWSHDAIDELMAQGVIQGNEDGTFAPGRTLNRAEVSKILVLATGVELDTNGGQSYTDVNAGDWFYDYVETMTNYGWINGYPDGSFGPAADINKVEAAKMVVNAFELDFDTTGAPHFDDVAEDAWFYNYVETAYNNGLMRGFADGTFGVNNDITRAEMVKVVYDAQLVVAGPTGTAEGTLEVELSSETPNGTNIPYNATSVPFQTIELTASDDADVEISSLTVTRLGLGDNDDFDNVWLEIDGFKVGNDKSINNDDIVELRFNPPIVVPAGQTLVADIVASLEEAVPATSNVGSHNRFAIVSADDIASTAANVVGDFPIEGEEMEIASYKVSEVSMSTLGSDTTVDVGDNFIEIGKFRLLNETTSNKDVELRAITFKNDGTAQLADVLENVALYVSGEQVSAETIIDGDYITFRLDNGVTGGYVIEDGDSRIFSVRADIVSAEAGDNINFKVDNYEDIVAIEIGTSFGVKAISDDAAATTFSAGSTTDSGTACNNKDAEDNCARLRAYAIDSGDLNVSRDPASLGNQQYAPGSNDVVVLTARLIVDQPLIVDGVTLRVGTGTDANGVTAGVGTLVDLNAAFDNFRVFLNDSLVDSENDFAGTTVADAYLNFNTTFEIAGTSILKLVANVKNDAPTGSKLKVTLDADDFDSPEYISTGDQVATSELLGSAEGSFVEITQSDVDITQTDGLSDGETIVAGVNDVTFLKFVLDNNDSGDVNVTSVTITAAEETALSGKTRAFQNFTTAIFSDGVQQGSSKNLSSVGVATFNDLSVIIPSAGQKEFTVVVNTIEASAKIVSQVAAASVNNTSVTVSTANAALLTVGDVLKITPETAPTTAAGEVTTGTEIEGTITAVNTTSGLISVPGAYGTATTATGTAGVTTLTSATTAGLLDTHTTVIGDALTANLCTITFVGSDNAAAEDFDCSDNVATLKGDQAIATPDIYSAVAVLDADLDALTGIAGYTVAAGTASTTVLTETASPFIAGNVTETPGTAPAGAITVANTTEGVATINAPTVALKHTIRFDVTAVDADNVENGQTVEIKNAGTLISAANPLVGTEFEMVQSGTLTLSNRDLSAFDKVIVANATEIEVAKINFNASDDDIEVKDIFLANDLDADLTTMTTAEKEIGNRVDFKLYNEAGQLIQMKQMTAGKLHFELANNDRISIPKDGRTFVTIKVDARNLTNATETGKRLKLALDTQDASKGVEAVTAATGSDIDTPAAGWGATVADSDFLVARTKLAFAHAAANSALTLQNGAADQGIYRFQVTADSAYDATLERVSFEMTSSVIDGNADGDTADGAADAADSTKLTMYEYGNSGYTGTPTLQVGTWSVNAPSFHFEFTATEEINAGQTKYYEIKSTNNIILTTANNEGVEAKVVGSNDTAAVNTGTRTAALAALAAAAGNNRVIWSDRSNNGTPGAYLNGYGLVMPSDTDGAAE